MSHAEMEGPRMRWVSGEARGLKGPHCAHGLHVCAGTGSLKAEASSRPFGGMRKIGLRF